MVKYLKKRIFLLVFLAIFTILCVLTYKDFGASFDEPEVYLWGKFLYTRVRGNDPAYEKDFVIPSKGSVMAYYNSSYPALLHQINKTESIEVNHLLNLLFSIGIFVAMYEALLLAFKNPSYAIIGPLLLFTAPRFMGDTPINPKDIPFAIVYFVALSSIYITTHWEQKKRILFVGLFFGLAQSWRVVGYSLYPIILIYQAFALLKYRGKEFIKQFINTLLEIVLIFIIGFFIHMITLPLLGSNPFHHFIDLMNITKQFPWKSSTLFMGQQTSAERLPLSYLPIWFGITTPILILFFVAITPLLWKKINTLQVLFLIALVVNLVIFFTIRPVIYDGVRHMIFLLPILVGIASVNSIYLFQIKNKYIKSIVLGALLIHLIFMSYTYIKLHPYEYTYFNIFTNGIKGADKQFETEFWGSSTKELADWINNGNKKIDFVDKKIGVYGSVSAMEYYNNDLHLNMTVLGYEKNKEYDYISCWYRWYGCEGIKGKIVYQVKRDGVVFNTLYKTVR